MKRFKRILHATDLSPASRRAFDMALDLAKQNSSELLLIHVLSLAQPYLAGDHAADPSLYIELEAEARRHAETGLSRLSTRAKRGKVRIKSLIENGAAADQIVRSAKSKKADLVVMGTHGRTGISKAFVGSVASRVVATAPCPVLTVRGR